MKHGFSHLVDSVLSQRWQERWWEEDYSWNGLAALDQFSDPAKKYEGWVVAPEGHLLRWNEDCNSLPRASLQDYWRRGPGSGREGPEWGGDASDEALLESGELWKDPEGKLWHIAHAPLQTMGGEPLLKSEWPWRAWQWGDEWRSLQELLAQRLLATTDDEACANFTGVICLTLKLDQVDDPHFVARSACLLDEWRLEGPRRLSKKVDFSYANLARGCIVRNVEFGEWAQFFGTSFGVLANFANCTFYEYCDFREAVFHSMAVMMDMEALGAASFDQAYFSATAKFNGSRFQIIDFSHSRFDWFAEFKGIRVRYGSKFTGAHFSHNLSFDDSRFDGKSEFDAYSYSDGHGKAFQEVSFKNVVFRGDATFNSRRFEGYTDFSGTVWCGRSGFHGAVLRHDVSFDGAIFPSIERKFWRKRLTVLPRRLLNGFRTPKSLQSEGKRRRQHDIAPLERLWAKQIAFALRLPRWRGIYRKMVRASKYYKLLEKDFRTLKLASEANRSKIEESRFYRLEMMARRRRLSDAEVPGSEKIFSLLYEMSAGFGQSIIRPLLLIPTVALAYAVVFTVIKAVSSHWAFSVSGFSTAVNASNFLEYLHLSILNIVRPLAVWSTIDPEQGMIRSLAGDGDVGREIVIKLICTSESAFVTTLLFLLAVTLRRRFQMG